MAINVCFFVFLSIVHFRRSTLLWKSFAWIARPHWNASRKTARSRLRMTKAIPANASPTLCLCSSHWWTNCGWRSKPWTNCIRNCVIWSTQWIDCRWFPRVLKAKKRLPHGWTHWMPCKRRTNLPKRRSGNCCSIWKRHMRRSTTCSTARKRLGNIALEQIHYTHATMVDDGCLFSQIRRSAFLPIPIYIILILPHNMY